MLDARRHFAKLHLMNRFSRQFKNSFWCGYFRPVNWCARLR
jgi:hypothetical protein